MKIKKKVQSKYFKAVLDGRKGFEVRLADFKYKPGDTLVLLEQKPGSKELTGRSLECEILYSVNTKLAKKFWSQKDIDQHGLVILSLRRKYKFSK